MELRALGTRKNVPILRVGAIRLTEEFPAGAIEKRDLFKTARAAACSQGATPTTPLNRRVHKQVSDGSHVTATAYVYDGWRCIEEWEATWPVGSEPLSPTYTLAAKYVHDGYIDELLVMRRDVDDNGSLEEYFYHAAYFGTCNPSETAYRGHPFRARPGCTARGA